VHRQRPLHRGDQQAILDQLRADAASRPATYGYVSDPTTAGIVNYYGFLEYAGGY
jgi:hypothetical protein